jgi:hypothetical protein
MAFKNKETAREYDRRWRLKNKDRINSIRAKDRLENPEKYRVRWRKHRIKNKERINQMQEDRRLKHKDEMRAARLKYRRENKDHINELARLWKLEHPEIVLQRKLNKYNLTINEYIAIKTSQHNCCAICKRPESDFKTALAIDHCHKTGKVRGLLCHRCNRILGNFEENTEFFQESIEYLKKYNTPPETNQVEYYI